MENEPVHPYGNPARHAIGLATFNSNTMQQRETWEREKERERKLLMKRSNSQDGGGVERLIANYLAV